MVAVLAFGGLLVSIFFLLWRGTSAELVERANLSSAIATMFALFAAIAAVGAVVWITTSDYRAQQAVKEDTARIRAALRSIIVKAVLTEKHGVDTFRSERDTLNQFLSSTSAFGYWAWVEEVGRVEELRTSSAKRAEEPEPWFFFFHSVASLADACEPPVDQGGPSQKWTKPPRSGMVRLACQLDDLLAKVDVNTIGSRLANGLLAPVKESEAAVGSAKASKTPLLKEICGAYGEVETEREDETRWKFRHLKKKGVVDPNVDMFVAVFDNDTEALKTALEAGADTSVTDTQVLAAHEAELLDFDPDQSPTE